MIERLFEAWSRACFRHPLAAVLGTALALAFFLASFWRLKLENDLDAMMPTESGRVLARIDRAFGIREQVFLVAETPDGPRPDLLLAFAREVERHLDGNELIAEVEHGIEGMMLAMGKTLLPYAPRFADSQDPSAPDRLLSRSDLDERVKRQLARLSLPDLGSGSSAAALAASDPLGLGGFLIARLEAARGAFGFDPARPQYFISRDGTAILIRIRGRASLGDATAVRRTVEAIEGAIAAAVASARAAEPKVRLEVRAGGGYFLSSESEAVVRQDVIASFLASLVLVFLLTAWTLRGLRISLTILPPLAAGIFAAPGILGLFRDRLPSLAMGSSAVLVGLGVDFGIHLLLRMRAERAGGVPAEEAAARAAAETGPGLLFAALTTAGAFLAFLISSYGFLRDMGALSAIGILGTLTATVTILPALAGRWMSASAAAARPPLSLGIPRVVSWTLRSPAAVLLAAGAVSVAAIAFLALDPPELEADLRAIHSRDSAALAAERRLAEVFGGSLEPLLLLVEAPGEEALEGRLRRLRPHLDRLMAEGALMAHSSAALLLPDPEFERRLIERFTARGEEALRRDILEALDRGGFDADELAAAVEAVAAAAVDPRPLGLARLRELGLSKWIETSVRPDPADPGRILGVVTLFPAGSLFDPGRREQILEAIRNGLERAGVQGALAGLYTVSAESAERVLAELGSIGGIALAAVTALVAIQFRSAGAVLLALLPVTLGCLWTAALFRLLGYPIHFMNAAVLPMVIGIGIDDGIHIVHRYRRLQGGGDGGKPGSAAGGDGIVRDALSITGTAVALTSFTTMIGFGSLAFSRNRGIASLGALCLIGIGSCLVISVTALPAALALLERRRRRAQSGS